MATLAVLGASLCAQIKENAAELQGMDLVCLAQDVAALRKGLGNTRVDILLVDLDQLGTGTLAAIQDLMRDLQPQSLLVAYDFSRRETIQTLQAMDRVRTLRKPLGVGMLKIFLMSFITRDIFKGGTQPAANGGPSMPETEIARRFTDAQLGRLQEIASSVQCECPNHVSSVVQTLAAFEAYSKRCENKNDADAAMHHTLWVKSMQARSIMEDALAQLVAFESIQL